MHLRRLDVAAAGFAMPLDHLGDRQGTAAIRASPEEIEIKPAKPCFPTFSHRSHATTPQTVLPNAVHFGIS